WWRRRTLVLPIRRIQSIDLKHNLISRWFGTGSLVFGVAGGRGYSDHKIPALREEKARALREQLLSYLA
ncbi:MAG TPA: PH domain-containing protein, partial [Sphingomicrobium sp.]|nr:PH domain-containing protein [Sphingomicrobium sp.]